MDALLSNFPAIVKVGSGNKLSCRLRGTTAAQKAEIAIELMSGGVAVKQLTKKQAAALTGARPFHIAKQRRRNAGSAAIVRERVDVVDRLIDRVLALGGGDRLLERLDQMTAPKIAAE